MNKIISLVVLVCILSGSSPAQAQSFQLTSTPYVGYGSMALAAADFNGDGNLDLAGFDNNSVLTVLTNNGNGAFSICSSNQIFSSIQSITAADVNHDGKVDIITVNRYENTITILTNNGAGTFTPSQTNATGSQPSGLPWGILAGIPTWTSPWPILTTPR